MEHVELVRAAAYIGAAVVMGIGSLAPAYAQGLVGAKGCESIGRNPESGKKIQTAMIIALGVIESSAVYCLIVAILLIYAS